MTDESSDDRVGGNFSGDITGGSSDATEGGVGLGEGGVAGVDERVLLDVDVRGCAESSACAEVKVGLRSKLLNGAEDGERGDGGDGGLT